MVRWLVTVLLGALVFTGGVQAAPKTYRDPFKYCAAVGTVDQPDERYTGPKVPLSIARGLQKAFGISADHPIGPFIRNTSWRCMGGKVYACNVGANIPCMAKANLSRTPTPAMTEYCQTNPGADVIPAYVTGRETVYLWGCKGATASIIRQVNEPDARGFLAKFWYRIEPSV